MLNELKVFVRAVELKSISQAARNLNLTPAVATHRIVQLERHFGARLLNRTTRAVQPSEAGLVLYEHAVAILASVERAESDVAMASGLPSGPLTVAAPVGFGRQVIAPLITEFQVRHPQIEVHLRLSDNPVDMLSEAIDVALRVSAAPDSSFIMRKLSDLQRVLCASPAYLEKHGTPERPEDLANHNCLLLRGPGSAEPRWTLCGPDGEHSVQVSGRFDADDGEVLTRWTLQGEGIIQRSYWRVAEHIAEGRLKVVLPRFPPKPANLMMLYPHRQLSTKARVFADFVIEKSRLWNYG